MKVEILIFGKKVKLYCLEVGRESVWFQIVERKEKTKIYIIQQHGEKRLVNVRNEWIFLYLK